MFYQDDSVVGEVTEWLRSHNRNILQIFQRPTEEEHADYLLEKFNPIGNMVLDVGCGTGAVAKLMKERRPELEFVLLNTSARQLKMCPDGMFKIRGDAAHIPLPDETMDNVMACYIMGYLDKEKGLAELRRVCRPGGVVFIVDMTGGAMPELGYMAHDWGEEFIVDDLSCERFLGLFPAFREWYPSIRPVIIREVKNANGQS